MVWSRVMLVVGMLAVAADLCPAQAGGATKARTALFDEIWSELSTHDAFFDPHDPRMRQLRDEYRPKIEQTEDEIERTRLVVRMLSRLGDGHTHLTTRWFLPDKPPPPLPLAGKAPLYRPVLRWVKFHRDYYARLSFLDEKGADGKPRSEDVRIVSIDGALVSHGAGWTLLNGPENSEVEVEFERADGGRFTRSFQRTQRVDPPKHFAPTTQVAVKTPSGEPTTKIAEIVIHAKRLEGNLGYIHVVHLVTTQVVGDFNAALDELMDTDGLILDLRDTHGGYPWIMLPIAGRFYDAYQKVASFDGRSPLIGALVRSVGQLGIAPSGATYRKPLVVLINDGTASMAEGLSFSLGDTGRALLVGRPTRGLNAAIRNTTLSNGMVLWHSWIRVNRLDGAHYQDIGVQPTEPVELSLDEARKLGISKAVEREKAVQLEHATRRLREKVAAAGGSGAGAASQPAATQPGAP